MLSNQKRFFLKQSPPDARIPPTGEDKPQIGCRSCRKRRGAAAVEFAIIAPLFFLLVFGMIEFGRMVMVQQILTNASREGARKAVLDGSTTTDVVNTVLTNLSDAKITASTSNVTINPANPATANYGDPITVTVTIPFSQVSWLPAPMLLSFLPSGQTDITLTAATVMRRETVQQ
ncbi:MAG: pilus assembly protein [Pirellulales bacterium]|nr:pilus assembly protein [Pirellulales bacterium]